MIAGPVTLNHFWSISNDTTKPFDLFSAIQSKFELSTAAVEANPKPDAAAFASVLDMVKIEATCSFSVSEWHAFCRADSCERRAMPVTLFDATRSGMNHSDPSVSIFDSTHVIEVRPSCYCCCLS